MLTNWEQWFALAGVQWRKRRGAAFSHGSMAIEAAIGGEGVVLGRSALVRDDLAVGRLIAPFPDIQLTVERGYDLVFAAKRSSQPNLTALRDWLLEEVIKLQRGA